MEEETFQTNTDTATVQPEVPSAPVSDTTTTSAAPPRTSRGRTGSRKSAAPATTEDKFTSSMSKAYDAVEAREGQPATPAAQPATEAPVEPLSPPNSLTGRTGLEIWQQTPREIQELILEREREAHDKISRQGAELAELRKAGGTAAELGQVLERYSNHIPRLPDGNPMAPHAVMESLLNAHHALETNPAAAIAYLAQSYGLDVGQIAPHVEAQRQQQMQAMQQLQHQYQQLQHQYEQHQNQRFQYLQQEIGEYIKAKDYWPEIENEVMTQIEAIKNQNPGLYAMDPMRVVREAEKRAMSITGVSDKRSVAEAKKRADEARRLGSLNARSVVGHSPPASAGKDMWSHEAWSSAYDRASGRG